MKKYVLNRLLQLIIVLFVITFLSYGMMRIAGSDAVLQKLENTGTVVSQEIIDNAREELGLDKPFLTQYFVWLGNLLHGDMGTSYISGDEIFPEFISKLPATLLLAVVSIILTVIVSIPLGILAALKQNQAVDYLIRVCSFIGNSLPNFFVSLLLMYIFAIRLDLLPVISLDPSLQSVILPALTLAISMSAKYLRQVRAAVLEELGKDYVSAAKARGIPFRLTLTKSVLKACLEHLVEVHERAATDLMIESIEADGYTVTITTSEPKPALLNYLSDPYGCIIDMDAGITDDGVVIGTGPYVVTSIEADTELDLVKNDNYWDGTPGYDKIQVLTISDGDTLAMALQSGEVDAAYGLAYANYALFDSDDYTFSGCATSRAFFAHMNFESEIIQDDAVRTAIAMGIDKEGFVERLLDGYGYAAVGVYPDNFSFGGDAVTDKEYDPEAAAAILEEAGWVDTDGDGIREKDGETLTIRWLTYPSRQELPLLAEYAQAALLEIGIEVEINSTADHNSIRQDTSAWDVYVSAMVTAPTGDPEYFFTTQCLDSSTQNVGYYHSDALEELAAQMAVTFDMEEREELAIEMQQVILDDDAFIFFSHLQMNMVSSSSVTGLTAHPCDFYEITADLAPAE